MQTLKHIIVDIYVDDCDNDDDLLSGILSVFEDMRSKNIIETVTIENMNANLNCRLGSDSWGGRIDEVIPIRVCVSSSLKRVTGCRDT